MTKHKIVMPLTPGSGGSGGSTTYQPFPAGWPTTSTIKAFCDAVNADTSATVGMAYLGDLSCSDLPTGLNNVDANVEIMDGPNGKKTIHVVCSSGSIAPYHWEYTYWNDGADVSGWVNFAPEAMTPEEVEAILKYGAVVSTTLANNSWATIRKVCEKGDAANYWSVGDTKTDVGTDGTTRTFRICDMSGLYGKHVVFEQIEIDPGLYLWNRSANVDDDSSFNNYSISDARTSLNVTIKAKYSAALQSSLTQTTVKVAKNGGPNLVDVTDYLFLPAEKELYTSRTASVVEEFNILQTFQYYQSHTAKNDHKKYRSTSTSAGYWCTRSPHTDTTNDICCVNDSGNLVTGFSAESLNGFVPFFAF